MGPQLVPSGTPGFRARRRRVRTGFEGEARFARQIDVSLRLAPAEAQWGTTAVLLGCGARDELRRAAGAVRDRCRVDVVDPLSLPVVSWSRAIEAAPGTESWLQHYVMREVRRRAPSLVTILAPSGAGDEVETRFLPILIGRLRSWGVNVPIAALRVREGHQIEWLVEPPTVLEEAG